MGVHTYEIVLKNGFSFTTRAEDCTISYSAIDGSCTKYKFHGIKGDNFPLYVNPSEIVAVLQRN